MLAQYAGDVSCLGWYLQICIWSTIPFSMSICVKNRNSLFNKSSFCMQSVAAACYKDKTDVKGFFLCWFVGLFSFLLLFLAVPFS